MMQDLNIPVFIFGSMIALLIGSIIHLIGGGKVIRFLFSVFFAWIGFWIGNYVAGKFNIQIIKYGVVEYGVSIAASMAISTIGFWLSGENKELDQ